MHRLLISATLVVKAGEHRFKACKVSLGNLMRPLLKISLGDGERLEMGLNGTLLT